MADLTGTTPADTYKGLLQVNDYTDGVAGNTGSNALVIQDGAGNATALAVSTDNVGIGTTSPDAALHLTPDSDVKGLRVDVTNGSTAPAIQIRYNNVIKAQLLANGKSYFNGGNVGIGTTDPSRKLEVSGVIGIVNATAPTSSPTDMVQLYAENVTASSELRVRDEAGNVTTLSPHAKDAPDSLYDNGKGVDEMHRVANHYLGTIVFTNVDRRNDLMQKQLSGEELPEDRTFKVTETFTEYNARTGADLQVEDWDANQQAMFDTQEEKVVARQAEIDAWDNEEEEAPEPLQSYVKKPKPDWLS
jgi:hypothetical protein